MCKLLFAYAYVGALKPLWVLAKTLFTEIEPNKKLKARLSSFFLSQRTIKLV